MRVTRYEAMEVLARSMRDSGRPEPHDFGLTEAGYNCMAQYVARAIAVGLFAKPPKQVRRLRRRGDAARRAAHAQM